MYFILNAYQTYDDGSFPNVLILNIFHHDNQPHYDNWHSNLYKIECVCVSACSCGLIIIFHELLQPGVHVCMYVHLYIHVYIMCVCMCM